MWILLGDLVFKSKTLKTLEKNKTKLNTDTINKF